MPGIGGGELARRAIRLRPDLKVAFITGYIDDVWSGDDGVSREFSVAVQSVKLKTRRSR